MIVTEKKLKRLLHYIETEIEDLKELLEHGYEWHQRKYALMDVKDFILEEFDMIKKEEEEDDTE